MWIKKTYLTRQSTRRAQTSLAEVAAQIIIPKLPSQSTRFVVVGQYTLSYKEQRMNSWMQSAWIAKESVVTCLMHSGSTGCLILPGKSFWIAGFSWYWILQKITEPLYQNEAQSAHWSVPQ